MVTDSKHLKLIFKVFLKASITERSTDLEDEKNFDNFSKRYLFQTPHLQDQLGKEIEELREYSRMPAAGRTSQPL